MALLKFISDVDLENEVNHLLKVAKNAKAEKIMEFDKNVIDPFSALFGMAGFEIDYKTWYESELARQSQKSLQNHIGTFHQNILGRADGWKNMKTGNVIDLVHDKRKIIAEVKNKHNTVTGGSLKDMYYTFERLVAPKSSIYKGFTAYFVQVVPKYPRRMNITFTPSDKDKGAKCSENELIRRIDGGSFYSLATGRENALEELYMSLPIVIAKITGKNFTLKEKEKLMMHFHDGYSEK